MTQDLAILESLLISIASGNVFVLKSSQEDVLLLASITPTGTVKNVQLYHGDHVFSAVAASGC